MKVTIREKKLLDGTRSLYLDIYHKGQRRYDFLNLYLTKNKVQNKETILIAEKIRTQREMELQNDVYGFVAASKRKMNFITYLESISSEKGKDSAFHCSTKLVKEFTGNIISFQQVDEKWLEDFKKFLLKKVSQNTAASYFQRIKQALKKAKMEKIITRNPGEFVSNIKNLVTERTFLELKELEKLAKTDCKNGEIKRAFLFSCFCGLRYSDILKLTWKEIKGNQLQLIQQKTKNFIYIPLHQTALDLLKKDVNIFPLDSNLVFNLPTRSWTNGILKEWTKEAGIKKNVSFHVARHTFATLSLTYGNDIYVTSSLLDHKNVKTTQTYVRLVDEKKKKAVDSIPKILIS